ncbi:MAG: tryptophan--tRNA ligase [candidate division Zixibacteria bacterium]|nr:tryptophan--tRNA ligase [candidate division Zixibacteria bacterium]
MDTILSGMQPTGQLHLGNYEGALKNWANLQDSYNMFLCIVDWHALTAEYDKTADLKENVFQMAVDFLAGGLDPDKCAIFIQSEVKEHAELHLLLSMLTTVPTLTRLPTYIEKKEQKGLDSYGFLGYPVLQAADILLYNAHKVPVGKDQEKHIWLASDLAKRFNNTYGKTFNEPSVLLTKFPTILGSDNRKMSKSLNNHIAIEDTEEETEKKLKRFFTDPTKVRKNDPGHPEECPVYLLHQIYTGGHEDIVAPCKSGELGCVDCKKRLTKNLNETVAPIREKRKKLVEKPDYVIDVLKEGARKARVRASAVMEKVRENMKMVYYK